MVPCSNITCRSRLLLVSLVGACCLAVWPSPLSAQSRSEEIPIPGGTSELSRALGLNPALDRARFITELTRAIYDTQDGTDSSANTLLRKLTAYLGSSSAAARTGAPQLETVPIPLPASVWSQAIFRRPIQPAALFAAIISDRRAAFLCYGLAALDDETLLFLSQHPALLKRLYENDAAIFAAFAGSLRIRNGAIVLPGGAAARPLWEAAVN